MSSSYGSRRPQSETADIRGHLARAGASASPTLSVGSGQDVGKAACEVTQGVRDALADAETLEYALRGIYYRGDTTQLDAARAAALGLSALACADAGLHQHAGLQAAEAARAAFRAVPALRETR